VHDKHWSSAQCHCASPAGYDTARLHGHHAACVMRMLCVRMSAELMLALCQLMA
jgi:hypothetical protein